MFNCFRKYIRIALLGAATLSLGSCIWEEQVAPPVDPARVLLVYVGTDNNLSGYEQEKLAALRDGWTGRASDRIVAYVDKGRGADARLIEISNLAEGEQPREIRSYGDSEVGGMGMNNSASAETLRRVIGDVLEMFPAESYGLLVFSHASGWLPEGVYGEFAAGRVPESAVTPSRRGQGHEQGAASRSVIIDGGDEMELNLFAAAIPDGIFDYIVFEACFMAGIEVAWELRNKAPYILASSAEIVHPGFAPVYVSATPDLLCGDLVGFGEDVFRHTLTYAENNPQRSATYSVIRTAGLEALADFISGNCDFSKEVALAEIQHFDRLGKCRLFFDFEDYFGRLLGTDDERAQFRALTDACIAWKAATVEFMTQQSSLNGFVIGKHSGLTTYIPQDGLAGLNEEYRNLGWTKAISP